MSSRLPYLAAVMLYTVVFVAPPCAAATGLPFKNLNTAKGLPHNTVMCVFQDSNGYMWFGTKDGVCRYDGYDYTTYREQYGEPSLSNSKILCIAEDDRGHIWVGTENGVNIIDPVGREVRQLLAGHQHHYSYNKINTLHFDPQTRLMWIATYGGLRLYDLSEQTLVSLPKDHPINDLAIRGMGLVPDGRMYIGTTNGFYLYDQERDTLTRIPLRNTPSGSAGSSAYVDDGGRVWESDSFEIAVSSTHIDGSGTVWIGTTASFLGKLPPGADSITLLKVPDTKSGAGAIRGIVALDSTMLLVGRNGIFRFDPVRERFEQVSINPESHRNTVYAGAYRDRNGIVWIGAYHIGVFYYSEQINPFSLVELKNGTESVGAIGRMFPDPADQTIWLGTKDAGIVNYDPATGRQRYYDLSDEVGEFAECELLLIHDGKLWIGSDYRGILLFDLRTRKIVGRNNAGIPRRESSYSIVNCCLQDERGEIWAGINRQNRSLLRYDRARKSFSTVNLPDTGVLLREIFCIARVGPDALWIGTRKNGLKRYDMTEGTFAEIPVYGREDLSIGSILQDSRGHVWVGTLGQGLIRLKPSGEVIQLFSKYEYGINDNVCGVLEDREGRIWVSSFYEMYCYDEPNDRFVKYDAQNDFPIRQVKPNSCLAGMDGKLYFGGENGLVNFDPGTLLKRARTEPPAVLLTDFLIHNRTSDPQLHEDIFNKRRLILRHDQNNVTFVFAGLNYIYPGATVYSYKLEGVDGDWTSPASHRQVSYGNLRSGEYRFHVQAGDGVEMSAPVALLSLRIRPAPWFSWWACVLYALAAGGVVALIAYYWKAKMNLEHRLELESMEKESTDKMHRFRIDLFTHFSHEIRTPLTLILDPTDDLLRRSEALGDRDRRTLTGIRRNIAKIMALVDQLMEFRRHDESRMKLHASEHDLVQLADQTVYAFSELARIRGHEIRLARPDGGIRLWYDGELIEKVFSNILMNAVKYADDGTPIEVEIERTALDGSPCRRYVDPDVSHGVTVSVFNRGAAIPPGQLEKIFEPFHRLENDPKVLGTGIGLSLTRMIMRLHHADIWAENTGEGVVFRFILPEGRGHLTEDELVGEVPEAAPEQPEADAAPPGEVGGQSGDSPRNLLLVEDEPQIRDYLREKLAEHYGVQTCGDGEEALRLIARHRIDIVVSDVMMPVMDGVELTRAIKQDPALNHIPVILLTARASDEDVKGGFDVGADAYMVKPFRFEMLLARIRNILANNERLRDAFQRQVNPKDMNVSIADYDQAFLERCYEYIRGNLQNPDLSIEEFGHEMGISRVHLYRKIKYLSDMSPSRFILHIRLKIAAELLRESTAQVSEICYRVGFNNLPYFTRSFRERYGVSPSEYRSRDEAQEKR